MVQEQHPSNRLTKSELIEFFRSGCKPSASWRVGTEYEKFLVDRDTGISLPYEGEVGIQRILEFLWKNRGWAPVYEAGTLVALKKSGASISLEPGGQFELSGAPTRDIHETYQELETHLADLDAIQKAFSKVGVVWKGFHPTCTQDQVTWMPKGRYQIMMNYLPTKGSLGTSMMKRTCTVQANLDYASQEDAHLKMRIASVLGPVVTALFANSSDVEGKPSGWESFRQHVWSDVDPDRCGNLEFLLKQDGRLFAHYAEWAMNVPLFFVVQNGRYTQPPGLCFGEWMEQGYEGQFPTLEDWELHLSTLFPNVRLKNYIEVRSADCVPPEMIPALPALWKGILYSSEAMNTLAQTFEGVTLKELDGMYDQACREGLKGACERGTFLHLASLTLQLAEAGLQNQNAVSSAGLDERIYLEPLIQRVRGT